MDLLYTALAGMRNAQSRLDTSASKVARIGADDTVDAADAVVEQAEAKQQFAASAAVVRLSNEMWRTLLQVQEDSQDR